MSLMSPPNRPTSLADLPSSAREFAASYIERMQGLQIVRSEFTVYNHAVGYAGTGDRVVRFPAVLDAHAAAFDQFDLTRGCFVLDNKTGKVSNDAAMQLAALANAEGIWDAETETFEALPEDLRTDIGFILDLKRGPSRLVPVDLTLAWPAFVGGVAVKKFCSSKPMFAPLGALVSPASPVSPAAAAGEADVRGGDVGTSRGREATTAPAPSVPYCARCDAGGHTCPGCGADVEHGVVACGVCPASSEPTHIADVLPEVVAAIPEAADVLATFEGAVVVEPDPFAGLPDAEGAPLPDRNVKLAWLTDQYEGLKKMGPDGLAALQGHWPADLPTLKKAAEAGREWGHDELARIEVALKAAGDQAGAIWPDVDPTDPTFKRVLNSDARVLALLERGGRLPKDLQGNVASAACTAELPSLTTGYLTEAHLPVIERIVADAEAIAAEWASEVDIIVATAGAYGLGRQAVLAVFGATDVADIVGDQLPLLDVFANALCVAGPGGDIFAEREGRIVVDRPADVLDLYMGDRQKVRKCAREYAKQHGWPAPAKADDALADVLITACLLADV